MTTESSGQHSQSEPDMMQKPPLDGRKDSPPIVWPWEETDDKPPDVEEVTDDEIEDSAEDQADAAPFPG
jgi:hypothetical protein